MSSAPSIREQARQWVDRLNSGTGLTGTWRLERVDFRSRYADAAESSASESGEFDRRDLPRRIRRFCNGMPWALVDEAIRYLHETAPYSDVVYNGVPLEGRYVPTRTWWQRDEQNVVDRGQQNQGTYTLYQDLVDVDRIDDLGIASGGSCSQEVKSTYVWDAFDVEPLTGYDTGQGRSVSVQAMSRNEDGTFNYAIVERIAKTQHMGPATTKCDAFETATVETWDNLYGAPGAYRDDTGAAVSVPEPCSSPGGTTVEVSVQENEDCTFKVAVQRTVANRVDDASTTRRQTLFEKTASDVDRAQPSPVSGFSGGSGGRVVTKKAEKRADGFYDNSVETVDERPVAEAEVTRSKTLRGTQISTTDRSQAHAFEPVLRVGERFERRMTPGGLVDQVVVRVDPTPVGEVARTREITAVHDATTVKTNVVDPPSADVGRATGQTRRRTVELTELGTYDVTDQVVDFTPYSRHFVGGQVSPTATRRRYAAHNASHVPAPTTVGSSVSGSMNESGLFDYTEEKVSRSSRTIGEELVVTNSETVRTVTKSVGSTRPNMGSTRQRVGQIVRRTAQLRDDGCWVLVEETRTAKQHLNWVTVLDTDREFFWSISFRNATARDRETYYDQMRAAMRAKLETWTSADRTPANIDVRGGGQPNDYGLEDGQFTFVATWSAGQAGQADAVDVVFFSHEDAETRSDTRRSYLRSAVGRGRQSLAEFLKAGNWGSGLSSNWIPGAVQVHFNFDPVTLQWAGTAGRTFSYSGGN